MGAFVRHWPEKLDPHKSLVQAQECHKVHLGPLRSRGSGCTDICTLWGAGRLSYSENVTQCSILLICQQHSMCTHFSSSRSDSYGDSDNNHGSISTHELHFQASQSLSSQPAQLCFRPCHHLTEGLSILFINHLISANVADSHRRGLFFSQSLQSLNIADSLEYVATFEEKSVCYGGIWVLFSFP